MYQVFAIKVTNVSGVSKYTIYILTICSV